VIHHERDVREEQQQYVYVARTSNNRVIAAHDLCCCLLPEFEALRTCRSGFPIATIPTIEATPMALVIGIFSPFACASMMHLVYLWTNSQ